MLLNWLVISISDDGRERVRSRTTQKAGDALEKRSALLLRIFLHNFGLREPFHALKVLYDELNSTVAGAACPCGDGFLVEHPVAEADDENTPRL